MNCDTCQTLLIDHWGGELHHAQAAEVVGHLTRCAVCALEYCRLDADMSGIAPAVEVEPGPEVFRALRARVQSEFRPSWLRRLGGWLTSRVPAYQVAVAAAAGALIATVASLDTTEPPPVAPTPSADATELYGDYDAREVVSVGVNIL